MVYVMNIVDMPIPFGIIANMRKRTWSEKNLRQAVKKSFSIRQVLIALKLRPAGGNYEQIKRYIKEYKLNDKHFKGKGWSRGLKGIGRPLISLQDIFANNAPFQSHKLKVRLFKENLKPQHCEECGWKKQTKDGYLPLELDHINGNRNDNRLGNLRILCPNCHSLKPTYRARNRRYKHARVA